MRRVLCLFLAVAFAATAFAQLETAAVSGRVTDPQGSVITGAKVSVTNMETGATLATTTNSAGVYSFPSLPPGPYRLAVNGQGFKEIVKAGLVLHVQDSVSQNFTMQVGSMSESVTVTAEAPLVNVDTPAVKTVIDRNFVENLPLNGRTFNALIQQAPGAVVAPSSRQSPGQFSINGQRTNTNGFTVDGASANFGVETSVNLSQSGGGGVPAFSAFGSTSSLVSIDAVQEFTIQTSPFAPEYGRNTGGQISIETRSGTNRFHGTVFDYFRNEAFDANDWFANQAGLPRAAERQNDFGGVFGGPIVKDRTFFFFSYEGLRLEQPHTQTYTVPSLMARASAIPAAAPYLNAFPLPTGPADPLNPWVAPFIGNFSDPNSLDAASLRLDQIVNDRFTLFARYNYAPSVTRSRVNLASSTAEQRFKTQTGTVGATWVPTATLSDSLRFNYSAQQAKGQQVLTDFGGAVVPPLDILVPPPASISSSFGEFALPDASPLDFGGLPANRESQVNIVNTVSWTVGRHQLKFGFDYRRLHLEQGELGPEPLYLLNSTQDFALNADALVFGSNQRPGGMALNQYSLFAQDSWKATNRLTLTYGLRWDVNPAPSPDSDTTLASWQGVATPATIQLAPAGTPIWTTKFGNVAPRIGIAYQLTESGDFVLRAGWGLFYDAGAGSAANLLSEFPNSSSLLTFQVLPVANMSSLIAPLSSTPPFTNSIIGGFDPRLDLPRSQQWNVALERSFARVNVVTVTYVGQKGDRQLRNQLIQSPNANFDPASLFELTTNGDASNYQALQFQYRRSLAAGLQVVANYTWSHSIDTGSDDSFDVASNTVIPAGVDRGSSAFDVRHNFTASLAYEIPKVHTNRVLSAIVNDWSLYSVIQARSGFPIDVRVLGAPIPGLTTFARPDVVPGEPVWLADPTAPEGQVLNPAAFSVPAGPRQGDLPRNSINGFTANQFDFSVARQFKISEPVRLQFRADFFNIFNHPNFANPTALLIPFGTPFFLFGGGSTQMLNAGLSQNGQGLNGLYQMGGPRSVQLSLKLTF